MLRGREPLFNEFSGYIVLWLLFLDNSDSLTSPLGHFCYACKKSKSHALINSEPLLSLSEPINTCCHTVIAPPKLFSTQYKRRVVKTLLRKSLVRPVANIRACAFQKDGPCGIGAYLPSFPSPHHFSSPEATFVIIY